MILNTMNLRQRVANEGRSILTWWRKHALRNDGTFYGRVTTDCIPDPNADLGVILATRILWTFSRAIHTGFEASAENRHIIDSMWNMFKSAFWDQTHLGVFWMVDANQQPVQTRKHIYAQSFAMYACAEYYAATGKQEALLYAQLIYECIERYARDSVHGGYFESFSVDWRPMQDQLGISDLAAPKSMNTHLHLLEAYTRLYQVWPNPELRDRLRDLLQVVATRIVNPQTSHFQLFFDADWRPLSDVISYGHDIEGSWLLCEAAEALGDGACIQATRQLAVQMVDATLAEGLDADGGLFNEGHAGRVIDDDKHWWPQAEAAVGLVNAYQITGNPEYFKQSERVWDFIEQHMSDRQYGEWYWLVDRSGNPDKTKWKVEPWKCPYHNTRACLELWQRLAPEGE
ncbi:mannobiose 2-epimerase [Alicyclobacillus sacchari]|uniref:Cellobiose 2-epimerase n=3 Tax=Alicyclobacillus sacchari TaxID=392010 RepID=A0A4R8LSJ6_9BACL|nr:mannobiose 2-epimerase [Alicyclobacillus sacchari]GMA58416.1 cellobiose 2-epimerase [Alicyclobacillus sacchari]